MEMTTQEAADKIGVSRITIYRYIQAGDLKAVLNPHGKRDRYMIDSDEVDRFIQDQQARIAKRTQQNQQ